MERIYYARASSFEEQLIYYPHKRPGYCAWVSLFPFAGDTWGLAFNEVRESKGGVRNNVTLEAFEATDMPYSYQDTSYPFATGRYTNEYVVMVSDNRGKTWRETARVPAATRHYLHVGFEDMSMVRVHSLSGENANGAPRFGVFTEISHDLGKTWQLQSHILPGYYMYVHKVKRLRNNWIVACGPISENFGPGFTRMGRHDVSEDVIANLQTCFLVSKDQGRSWSQPQYILPGIPAWEPDFVDLEDGSLLFVNSDVQAARSVRQLVRYTEDGYINEPLRAVFLGAEQFEDGARKPGYVPESIALTPEGLLVGARRHGAYAVSNDMGANWYRIDAPLCQYQPILHTMPGGEIVTAWHFGGDAPIGQKDMHIGLHRFRLEERLLKPVKIHIERMLSDDKTCYENKYRFRMTSDGQPLAGQTLTVRYRFNWNKDGTYNTSSMEESAHTFTIITDKSGEAVADLSFLSETSDIFLAYYVDGVFCGDGLRYTKAQSDCLYAYVMSPKRGVADRYAFYVVNGTLVMTEEMAERYPKLERAFAALATDAQGTFSDDDWALAYADASADKALDALARWFVVERVGDGRWRCKPSTHQVSNCIRECRTAGNDVVFI